MIDLDAMKQERQKVATREPVKTYLTIEARARLKAAAAFTSWHEYEVLEELIMKGLPPANTGS